MPNSPHIVEQYRAVQERGGLYHRTDRGVIEVSGKDRASWLNNLVTNIVTNLSPGEGNYAFATNIKGRTVFDLGILVLEDRLWLDIDRRWIEKALQHLNKYVISEDVQLRNLSEEVTRIAVIGPTAGGFVADKTSVGNLVAMGQWQHVSNTLHLHEAGAPADKLKTSASVEYRVVRNDFCGMPAADFYFTGDARDAAASAIEGLATQSGLAAIIDKTVEILRIEAGIPASVDDIDEDVVPPETGRVEQGISYHKGCYLGQEVIERMRSHGILARRLVGLKLGGDHLPPKNSLLRAEEKDVGRITSACWSEALAAPLALGYVKAAFAQPGKHVSISAPSGNTTAEIVALPVKSS
jgi:folate-binding protein YgfZ